MRRPECNLIKLKLHIRNGEIYLYTYLLVGTSRTDQNGTERGRGKTVRKRHLTKEKKEKTKIKNKTEAFTTTAHAERSVVQRTITNIHIKFKLVVCVWVCGWLYIVWSVRANGISSSPEASFNIVIVVISFICILFSTSATLRPTE